MILLDVMKLKTWLASVLLLTVAMLTATLGNLYLFFFPYLVCISQIDFSAFFLFS